MERAVAGTSGVGQQGFDQVTNLVASFWGDGATPAARMSNPYPNGPINPPGSSLGLMNDVGYGGYGPIRGISNNVPNEQSWSFGIQHETQVESGVSMRPTSARKERTSTSPMPATSITSDRRSSTTPMIRLPI